MYSCNKYINTIKYNKHEHTQSEKAFVNNTSRYDKTVSQPRGGTP